MKWISFVPLFVLFTSCGKGLGLINSAPKSQDQAGIIASCTSVDQAKSLSDELGIQYRVLSKKHKMIEFYKVDKKELKKRLPKAKLKSNIVFEKTLIESENFKAQNVSNKAFYGAHVPQYADHSTERYFPHLAQIDAHQEIAQGEGVVIAIIDTGVDYNHPHLSPNILENNLDKHGNNADGKDNDNNNYIDDQVGWDFYNGDAYPNDDNGHGTHVAGLAASTYMGIAPKAKILPVKVLSSTGSGDLGTVAAGILYALDRKADIINLSLGGSVGNSFSKELKELISSVKIANTKNSLVIAAAGNGGSDGIGDCNDEEPQYPANIQEDNMIAVASVDAYNQITNYSNFGGETVHVAAPGGANASGALLSTALTECEGPCSSNQIPYTGSMGTSMATPIVAGLAAVIKSHSSHLSNAQIKEIIMNSVEIYDELKGLIKSSGIINVSNALNAL